MAPIQPVPPCHGSGCFFAPPRNLGHCPAPKFGAYFGCLVTKNLKAPKWNWLILDPMGALEYTLQLQHVCMFILQDLFQQSLFILQRNCCVVFTRQTEFFIRQYTFCHCVIYIYSIPWQFRAPENFIPRHFILILNFSPYIFQIYRFKPSFSSFTCHSFYLQDEILYTLNGDEKVRMK